MQTEDKQNTIYQVEQHLIHRDDPRWQVIDTAAFVSKNLYNAANYILRQAFIFEQRYLPYEHMAKAMQSSPDFQALPAKVAQQVLRQLDQAWQAFFAASQDFKQHPEKYLGRPRLPKYKHKTDGRNVLIYTAQAVSKRALKKGAIVPSGLPITVTTQHQKIRQVRIVPHKTHYVVEVIYAVLPQPIMLNPALAAAIDLGVNNLATLTSNKPGFVPRLVNGRPLKALNQFYNKQKATLQSQLKGNRRSSRRIRRLGARRDRQIKAYLHTASRRIIELLAKEHISTLVIGKNDQWKQEVNLGSRNNQNFVYIPHSQLIAMLSYKAQLIGIKVILTEESYTSKCSFLDAEPLSKQKQYAGRRIARGLFRTKDGRQINADVNGSYNILRKVIPNAFDKQWGTGGVVVHPVRLDLRSKPRPIVVVQ